jgi:phosphatidylglycerol---prolipoprotein diacylglyceryl transferase
MIPMMKPYVHNIDPVIGSVLGVYLWWYGFFFVAGFLTAHVFLRFRRAGLGMSLRSVYMLSLLLAACVVAGGRLVEVVFYEWPYYHAHPVQIPALWIGGMSTHGLLLGGFVALGLFSWIEHRSFLGLTDVIVVPAALIMAFARFANFVDGQIVGGITDMPWAVKFPDADGFRHPVVLYDGLKNLLIVPILMAMNRFDPPRGMQTGVFLLLYAGLRLFVDLLREYPTTLLGLATGQVLNLAMAGIGLLLIVVSCLRGRRLSARGNYPNLGHPIAIETSPHWWQPAAFALLLASCLVIPSDWTQDVPKRYGKRHAGLTYSTIYPRIESFPKNGQQGINSSDSSNQVAPGEGKGATIDKGQN